MGVYIQGIKPYFKDQNSALFLADTFEALANMKSECIDMIFAVFFIKQWDNLQWWKNGICQ